MKIVSVSVELRRADISVAQFLIRVELDGNVEGCEVKGSVIGPRCPGITTVEIAYPLVLIETRDKFAILKGVIPEPNLWSPESPFQYEVNVSIQTLDGQTDRRRSMLGLRGRE
jgi:hypothetical protein